MTDWANAKNWVRIVLSIIFVGAIFGVIAVVARLFFGEIGITAVDIGITGVLTAALVYLYFQQTRILESQRDLFTQQLNREARQQHTETLREQVRMWHGNPERRPIEHFDQGPLENLPQVVGARFQSAQNLGFTATGVSEEREFHTVPWELRDDPYFEDLLENHATDLRESKSRIEQFQKEFVELQKKFLERYDDEIIREHPEYSLEPDSNLAKWIFELVVLSSRDLLYGNDTIADRAISDIENEKSSLLDVENSALRIDAKYGRGATRVYSAVFDEAEEDKLREHQETIESEVRDVVEEIVSRIDDDEPYSYARDAADMLNQAETEIAKLDELLIEYYGRPIYSGDCKYLKEARI